MKTTDPPDLKSQVAMHAEYAIFAILNLEILCYLFVFVFYSCKEILHVLVFSHSFVRENTLHQLQSRKKGMSQTAERPLVDQLVREGVPVLAFLFVLFTS